MLIHELRIKRQSQQAVQLLPDLDARLVHDHRDGDLRLARHDLQQAHEVERRRRVQARRDGDETLNVTRE